MLEVMQAFCDQWDGNTWQVAFTGALSYLFDLPKTQIVDDEDAAAVVSNVTFTSPLLSCLKHTESNAAAVARMKPHSVQLFLQSGQGLCCLTPSLCMYVSTHVRLLSNHYGEFHGPTFHA